LLCSRKKNSPFLFSILKVSGKVDATRTDVSADSSNVNTIFCAYNEKFGLVPNSFLFNKHCFVEKSSSYQAKDQYMFGANYLVAPV
jgi:hypothetical protein